MPKPNEVVLEHKSSQVVSVPKPNQVVLDPEPQPNQVVCPQT